MASTEPRIYDVSEYEPAPGAKHVHHGRTVAAWAGSMIALVGFVVGGLALVFGSWLFFWIGVVIVVASLIVTVVLRKIGMGAV